MKADSLFEDHDADSLFEDEDAELEDDARPSRPKLFGVNGPVPAPARRAEPEEEEEDEKSEEEKDPEPLTLVISIADTGGNEILSEYEMTAYHTDYDFSDFLDQAMDAARDKINFDHENYLSVLEHLKPEELSWTFDGNTGKLVKGEEVQDGRGRSFKLAKDVDTWVREEDNIWELSGGHWVDVNLDIFDGHGGDLSCFNFQVVVKGEMGETRHIRK